MEAADGLDSAECVNHSGLDLTFSVESILFSSSNLRKDVQDEILEEEGSGTCDCCCPSHHTFQSHVARPTTLRVAVAMPPQPEQLEALGDVVDDAQPYLDVVNAQGSCYLRNDPFFGTIVALDTDFSL